jgi:hypothetical protein
MNRAVQKGKKGENEACEWIRKHLFDGKREVKRNHNQAFIGADIVCYPFIFEIKRREKLALDKWWIQIHRCYKVLIDHKASYIPVVMFRINNGQWEFLISAETIGCDTGYVRIGVPRFTEWARRYV